MASKQKSLGITSRSEQRKGFTMPTLKRIKSVFPTCGYSYPTSTII